MVFPDSTSGKEPTYQCQVHKKFQVRALGEEEPLEDSMATHSSILARKTPWTEEPGRLQSMELQRIGHDWSNLAHTHLFCTYFRKLVPISILLQHLSTAAFLYTPSTLWPWKYIDYLKDGRYQGGLPWWLRR